MRTQRTPLRAHRPRNSTSSSRASCELQPCRSSSSWITQCPRRSFLSVWAPMPVAHEDELLAGLEVGIPAGCARGSRAARPARRASVCSGSGLGGGQVVGHPAGRRAAASRRRTVARRAPSRSRAGRVHAVASVPGSRSCHSSPAPEGLQVSPRLSRYFCASSAAMQPVPALVTAWR